MRLRRNRKSTPATSAAPTANTPNAMPTADPVLSPESGEPECAEVDWVNGRAVVVNIDTGEAVLAVLHGRPN